MELERAIENDTHHVSILRPDELPKCLLRHISTANRSLTEPFSRSKLKEYTKTIACFLHAMTENREWLDECRCNTLIDFMEILPDADDLLEYKRSEANEMIAL